MVTLLAFIGFATIFAVLVGVVLWRQWSSSDPKVAAPNAQLLEILDISASKAYGPVHRLFADEDFQFLAGQAGFGPALVRRLRRARWQVLRRYLRELRADFRRVVGIGRAMAAQSENPGFAAFVSAQVVKFYSQLSLVYIYCFLRQTSQVQKEVSGLADALDRFRAAMRALQVAEPHTTLANH